MLMFFDLPRELRDKIYRLCLVSDKPINLTSLQPKESATVTTRKLDLIPNLLVTSQSVQDEAELVLYGENLFYIDMLATWRHRRSRDRRHRFSPGLRMVFACLACNESAPSASAAEAFAWNNKIHLIRRCQILLQPYDFLRWWNRHSGPFSTQFRTCQHSVISLPPDFRPDFLAIRVVGPALIPPRAAKLPYSWTMIQNFYHPLFENHWRTSATQDLFRDLLLLLQHVGDRSLVTVLSSANARPLIQIREGILLKSYAKSVLSSGCLMANDEHGQDERVAVEGVGEAFIRYLQTRSEAGRYRVFSCEGNRKALQSMYQDLASMDGELTLKA